MESTFVAKRLDRAFCCPQARLKWQEAEVSHLPFLSSDHRPLYVQLCPTQSTDPRRRPFRFEAAWLKHEGYKELLVNSWNPSIPTPVALHGLQGKLKKWNKEVFGDIHTRKESLCREIQEVQDLLDVVPSDDLLAKEEQLMKSLDVCLEQEESLWSWEIEIRPSFTHPQLSAEKGTELRCYVIRIIGGYRTKWSSRS